ncbi:Bifunctional PGK/TIM [Posidoniimonas polymericola]|uniref:Phosphoglycerate kinase n=1 Tax=Posidoniimonas polymericola TaxID=2528002 RepID=A0A5C5YDI3_9BACT|nr:phosphoglycerate kinase [Posidoniimonas polymericola]TWT73786.1 Bifunctional PGK/TIM [Posidoniimonas polymericola]
MSTVSVAQMKSWCEKIVKGREAAPDLTLGDYLSAVPSLDSLSDVPAGTVVLVRGDVDAKPGASVGEGDIRLRSMVETLKYGIAKGWKQVVFGHIGREPEKSLDKVAKRLGELLGQEVPLIKDWVDTDANEIKLAAAEAVKAAEPGSVVVLENTRAYDIERVLWKAKVEELEALAPKLAAFANSIAEHLTNVYVNEAFSAGSLDVSSVVVPAVMDRVALGKYAAGEFNGPMQKCLKTDLAVFSGIKIDKLDDMEAMIARGTIKQIFASGSLAMAIRKAIGMLDNEPVCLGAAEDPANSGAPWYIPPARVEQAKAIVADGREKGITFTVPVDSVIEDGSAKDTLTPSDQQLDIGPKSIEHFHNGVGDFIEKNASGGAVAFHNGVFGMFEDPKFEAGTKAWIPELKRMKDAGVEVYVGGGEGGKALDKYGEPDWVTHCFTAGGTVLNALGSEPVPYLVALKMAAEK